MNLAIVITAYNRVLALDNLLKSLLTLQIPKGMNVPLIIGIDNKGTKEVNKIAYDFEWPFGPKEVVIQPRKQGLVKQFIWAGDQSLKYDNVIFLEDDLLVSPYMLLFTLHLLEFYSNEPKVAAASLYNPILCEGTGQKFYQILDDSDVYFLQQPYWGHVWIKNKWVEFKQYLGQYICKPEILPTGIAQWTQSFKKIYIQFLIEKDYYVATVRDSYVTNNGVAGLHGKGMFEYQNNLQLKKNTYRFLDFSSSISVYDAFEEILPRILKEYNCELQNFDFEVDIKGQKSNYKHPYVLTTKHTKSPILQFSALMKPTELSIFMNQKRNQGLSLCRKEDVIELKSYYRKRRYNDIQKNYYIGLFSAYYIFINDCLKGSLKLAWAKTKKCLKLKKS